MAEVRAASKASAVDPIIGRSINGRFKITALIARGGMGKVYRAEQAPLGRLCAVKILNPNYAGEQDPEFHKRFILEANIASKLTHPNTVTIFEYGRTDDDVYYMAMEFLDGVTLHRAIREVGRLPEERVAHIARQICRALREAHGLGVIHRDLKPANIFLVDHGDESDFVKVLDFGLVKNVVDVNPEDQLTQTGLFMGSPKYMAPEQVRGDRVDARTDVYSLGIMMYEMLTGKVPFDRPNSLNILMAQVNEDVPPIRVMNRDAEVSPAMEELVARCLAKDASARCRSMDEVLAVLRQIGRSSLAGTGDFRVSEFPSGMANTSGPHPAANASGSMPIVAPGFPSTRPPPVQAPPPSSGVPSSHQPLPLVTRAEGSGTPPPMDTQAIEVPKRRQGPKAFVAGAVCAAIAAGVVFALSQRATSREVDVATAPPPPAVAADPAPAPSSQTPPEGVTPPPSTAGGKATPASMVTHLTSEPAGAVVKEDGKEVCAATPCDHDFGSDVTREHKLVFSKPGFRLETRTLHTGDSPVSVRFARAPAWTAPAAPPPKPAEPSAPTPQGFKEIPY